MKKIVYFDFCNTLVDFETANEFSRYIIKKEGTNSKAAALIRDIIAKLKLLSFVNTFYKRISVNKALWLYQTKGLSKKEIEEYAHSFYKERIKPHLIEKTLNMLISYKEAGDHIVIVSGGYDAYLSFFADEYDVDLICTRLLYRNGIFTGKIDGIDCMKGEKVIRIQKYLEEKKINMNGNKQIGFSDSETDVPMLEMCQERYIVIKKEKEEPEWVKGINGAIIFY